MTQSGGVNGYGTIFSFDPNGNVYSKLMEFNMTNGRTPTDYLIKASDGKLYGLTRQGGANTNGVVFRFDVADTGYTVLKDFQQSTGWYPYGGLTEMPLITGESTPEQQKEILVYPNPAREYITLRLNQSGKENYLVSLINDCGEMIKRITATAGSEISLDVKNLSDGIYLVKTD